ncbi:hypothetical protein L218DRAFT_957923 [Marasmius fiardii PR-910]|nr:hypothetical protein L218DRAFT_957923 [Marasmius fiardii PR-910]
MVLLRSALLSAALFSGFVSALPTNGDNKRPDEIPVSAPDGTPTSDVTQTAQSTAGNYGDAASGGYGGGYGGGGGYDMTTSSAMKSEQTGGYGGGYGGGGYDMTTTSSAMKSEETSSSMMQESTSTSSMYESMPTYGSGSSNWGSGYDDCVQKCVATYGAPPATYQPTATSGSEGSKGSGSTVTVVVAPTAGVFRFVPVAVNASVGTTIQFMWGADTHTVTKGSALLPCNKSAENPVFASGVQKKDFVFTQVVNDTNPTFYFCGVADHCEKGMFGMINPPSAFGAATSAGGMMQSLMANDSNLQAYAAYTANNTQGKAGSNWGSNIDLQQFPDWARSAVAENILFTRNMLAMNPDVISENGSIDMSNVNKTGGLMIPQDISLQLNAAGSSDAGAAGNTPVPANGTPAGTSSAAQPANTNGASIMASPKLLVAVMTVVATFFAL